jgi:hypothetical protein
LRRKIGEEIVLNFRLSQKEDEEDVRWVFSDITPASFSWGGEESTDGRKTWVPKKGMKVVPSRQK